MQLYGKNADPERRLAWYRESALCPECFKAKKRQEEKEAGLCVAFRTGVDPRTGELSLFAVFEGDTYPSKDAIKALGARWSDEYPSDNALRDLIRFDAPPKRWCARLDEDALPAFLAGIEALGAKVVEMQGEDGDALASALSRDLKKLHADG